MITIGLVGGVASGKSVVACEFQKLGAAILNGDRIGHEVLTSPSVQEQLVDRWGKRVLDDAGALERSKIASIVFGNNGKANKDLKFLESVTHPEIGRILAERLQKMRELGRFPLAVIDAAVMIKAGWDSMCDQIVFVDAPIELRRKRAQLRGLGIDQFEAREASQTSVEEKRNRSDIVIDNSGPPQQTFRHVEEVWQSLLQTT